MFMQLGFVVLSGLSRAGLAPAPGSAPSRLWQCHVGYNTNLPITTYQTCAHPWGDSETTA